MRNQVNGILMSLVCVSCLVLTYRSLEGQSRVDLVGELTTAHFLTNEQISSVRGEGISKCRLPPEDCYPYVLTAPGCDKCVEDWGHTPSCPPNAIKYLVSFMCTSCDSGNGFEDNNKRCIGPTEKDIWQEWTCKNFGNEQFDTCCQIGPTMNCTTYPHGPTCVNHVCRKCQKDTLTRTEHVMETYDCDPNYPE
jgi:hypothetical protein